MAVHQDVDASAEFYAGEDKLITFTVDGTPDITDWHLLFQVRLSPDHPDTMLEYTDGAGITILTQSGGTKGKFTVTIGSADWAAVRPGTFAYGAARTNPGAWDVQAEGLFVINHSAVQVS